VRECVTLLILGVLLLAPGCVQSSQLENGQWIVFVSHRDGNAEIYKMRPDGSELTRLTDDPAPDTDPCWSPDGSWIVFVSERDAWPRETVPVQNNTEIYKIRADGSQLIRLTNNPAPDRDPSWSPDGNWVLFSSTRNANPAAWSGWVTHEIYKVKADGSELIRLTDNPADDQSPSWCPDANWIAFISNRDAWPPQRGDPGWGLYKMKPDGTEATRLTESPMYWLWPSWSPDANWVAFVSDEHMYKVSADGSDVIKLADSCGASGLPSWSPDGDWIAFESHRDGNSAIYRMRADGSNLTRLTDGTDPSWSPDGNWIVFVTSIGPRHPISVMGNTEIHKMRADGSQVTRLTHNPSNRIVDFIHYLGGYADSQDEQPSWGP
jgi:Tol biopolymer transport system component